MPRDEHSRGGWRAGLGEQLCPRGAVWPQAPSLSAPQFPTSVPRDAARPSSYCFCESILTSSHSRILKTTMKPAT